MGERACELCKRPAAVHCAADGADLCWACNDTVHAANFLVARHHRTLLCGRCHVATPWSAAGPHLGPTHAVCNRCSGAGVTTLEPILRPGSPPPTATVLSISRSDDDDDDDGDEDEVSSSRLCHKRRKTSPSPNKKSSHGRRLCDQSWSSSR